MGKISRDPHRALVSKLARVMIWRNDIMFTTMREHVWYWLNNKPETRNTSRTTWSRFN